MDNAQRPGRFSAALQITAYNHVAGLRSLDGAQGGCLVLLNASRVIGVDPVSQFAGFQFAAGCYVGFAVSKQNDFHGPVWGSVRLEEVMPGYETGSIHRDIV